MTYRYYADPDVRLTIHKLPYACLSGSNFLLHDYRYKGQCTMRDVLLGLADDLSRGIIVEWIRGKRAWLPHDSGCRDVIMIQRCMFVSYVAIVAYAEAVMNKGLNLGHKARSA